MRRDPLTAGVSIVADVLKICPWTWMAVLAVFAMFVGAFQVVRTNTAVPTPTPSQSNALDFIKLAPKDWSCARDGANMKFTGQVRNSSATASMRLVKLSAFVYDQGNGIVGSQIGFVDESVLYPNSVGHFTIYVADPDQRGAGCTLNMEEAVYR